MNDDFVFSGFYFLFKDIDHESIESFKTIMGTMMQVIHMTLGEFRVSFLMSIIFVFERKVQ